MKRIINCILLASLTIGVLRFEAFQPMTAEATTMEEIQQEINRIQKELEEEYGKISDLEAEQDLILEQMDDKKAELINTMASIGMKEEEIAEKQSEIVAKEDEISEKKNQIVLTAAEYEAARDREEQQRLDMIASTKMIYEQGDISYLSVLLRGQGFSDVLDRLDYIEKVFEYSKMKLDDYIEAKDQIQILWDLLEQEKVGLELDMAQLEADKADLLAQKADLDEQKSNLNVMMEALRRESANYEAAIDRARQEAAVSQTLLKQNQEKLKQLQAAQNAANANYTSNYDSIIDKAAGTDLGRKIAKFACQYIGNPYVAGGTSLTNGADCSGFTYAVYSNFGYSIPRTSYQQRSAGTGVSYENVQVGDLICYDGHVALYIGGGLIVHASNSNPYPRGGIKVNNANYRTILAVRRIL